MTNPTDEDASNDAITLLPRIDLKFELTTSVVLAVVGLGFQLFADHLLPWYVLLYSFAFGLAGSALLAHLAWGNRTVSLLTVFTICALASALAVIPISWYLKHGDRQDELKAAIVQAGETFIVWTVPYLGGVWAEMKAEGCAQMTGEQLAACNTPTKK